MRLWSLHPKYLDPQGLMALWREALLAQAVLHGETRGYRNHPQIDRFKTHSTPLAAISLYLKAIHAEAQVRGYDFERSKICPARKQITLSVTSGQIEFEWAHLLKKLCARNPTLFQRWNKISSPDPHPLFMVHIGGIEPWERTEL
jgi:hypothetical protein